tara:strand:- start:491 stop:745 length:255 start_codon:yes stop_codon:yes gene_type:complete
MNEHEWNLLNNTQKYNGAEYDLVCITASHDGKEYIFATISMWDQGFETRVDTDWYEVEWPNVGLADQAARAMIDDLLGLEAEDR